MNLYSEAGQKKIGVNWIRYSNAVTASSNQIALCVLSALCKLCVPSFS